MTSRLFIDQARRPDAQGMIFCLMPDPTMATRGIMLSKERIKSAIQLSAVRPTRGSSKKNVGEAIHLTFYRSLARPVVN
jgi:hypothetical protein